MNSVLRQRLVGTLVLIALGVVFWPIIFVEPPEDAPMELAPPPPRPNFDTTPLPKPSSPEDRVRIEVPPPKIDEAAQARADAATVLDEEQGDGELENLKPATEVRVAREPGSPPEPSQLDAAGFPVAWALQVATVGTAERANELTGQLVAKGYPAFAYPIDRDNQSMWRVQIGPKLERAQFLAIKEEVDRVLDVESVVVRYVQP